MNKTIIIIIAVIVLAGLGFWVLNKNSYTPPQEEKTGIIIESPLPNQEVSSPLTIKGHINKGGWTAFEAQAGVVRMVDQNNNELGLALLQTEEDWMKVKVNFQASLEFNAPAPGTYNLVFKNENASGLPENDRQFVLPVYVKEASSEKMTIKAFFNNSNLDPEASCNKVFPVNREVPKTQATARAAIEELLKGPTQDEKSQGYFTSINSGVKIQSLTIENGKAKIDFNSQLEFQAGGSCRVSAIRAQIIETLKQFPSVSNVVISIDGRTEDILQP